MSFTHDERPAADLGPLTLADLELRSEKAHDDHMATYAATEVLHQAFMSMPAYDEEAHAVVDAAFLLIREYREKTHAQWRGAYREWATAAGVEIPAHMTDTATSPDDTEGEV
ncbi:hypothetical protein [Pseudofrankia asymbiotica]|uniref:Uncharacterized protein n=1 Tax=Pseudofrankia asymbiotica TaxID=1834516 RepID=A0A1V2I0T3_9ACTN|nr:hypothetical protein [Pseudofrankia asymbiotica]ONH23143.1 hypothetical protein BL253_33780 [Pseudofrankia asymbiotica]